MAEKTFEQQLAEAVDVTIRAHRDVVSKWKAREPGAWGFLAGQAVLALRRGLGRRLEDHERRMVWQRLWETLTSLSPNGLSSKKIE